MGAAIVFSDLTEIKELEKHLRLKNRLTDLGSLTSNIAHELRNPLNIIRMCAKLLENNLDKAHKQDIKVILDQVSLCDQRIKELLIFCKPIPRAKLKEVNINKFLEALLKDLDKRNLFSNIELVKKFDESLPPVLATGKQLRHIFINLIENATHAMKAGSRLTIRTESIS
jgi:nitrogen-specific signal transduction histidine kinase